MWFRYRCFSLRTRRLCGQSDSCGKQVEIFPPMGYRFSSVSHFSLEKVLKSDVNFPPLAVVIAG
jgi:hypothetical protein